MLSLLSPAKRLDFTPHEVELPATLPALLDQAAVLDKTTRRLSASKLGALMGLSNPLAALTDERFASFDLSFESGEQIQAALGFAGDVYVGLDARTLSAADLSFAQDRVVILSGLFGALRPLDLIQPHRLEMGTPLVTRRGRSLYDFWGDRVTKRLNQQLAEQDRPVVINLASDEYYKVVQPRQLNATVVTPVFLEKKDGKSRVISFMTKKARGMMVRYQVSERIDRPEGLRDFRAGGYAFQPDQSDETRWVFERDQPPPPAA